MIELGNVTVRSGPFTLSGLNLAIASGGYAVLMGRTGSGKTTLLEAICGLRPLAGGKVVLCGNDVTAISPAAREIGYVPQDLALFPTMSVREHLQFALKLRRFSAADQKQRVEELGQLLQLEPLLQRRVNKLSGGEAQRVALGRALSFHPRILLLDEPLSALDEETRQQMQSLLKQIPAVTGVTVLHVTHSREEARALGDQLFVLDSGKLTTEAARWDSSTQQNRSDG